MKTVTIRLDRKRGEPEEFERNDKNLIQVSVRVPSAGMVCNDAYLVELSLSRDAMLGLGTELIRAAYRQIDQTGFWHFRPSEPQFATKMLGVYLHPNSCQLIIAEVDHGTLESLLNAESERDKKQQ